MARVGKEHESNEKLIVPQEVVEFVHSDEIVAPGQMMASVWPRILKDPRFQELAHGGLVYAVERFPGLDDEAIARFEGFIEGLSFATEAMRRAIEAERGNRGTIQILEAIEAA